MSDDSQLLRQYLEGSEAAFGELVSRYVNLVYSAALRQTGIIEHAQDVAQSVFTTLARKARTLPPNVVLGGWLYRHTCFVSAQWMRTERRRQARERQAVIMNQPHEGSGPDWEKLAPVLDDAMKNLGDADRNAIVLRYFEKRELQSVGAALGISDEAARKRVSRALEKLRVHLARKGVTSTAAALALALTGNAVTAAPVGFAAILTSASLLGAATMGTGTTLTFLKALTMTKLQTAIVGVVLVAGVITSVLIRRQALVQLNGQNQEIEQRLRQLARINATHERLSSLAAQNSSANDDPTNELLKIRAEAEQLRGQIIDLPLVEEEVRRLKQPPESKSETPMQHRELDWARRNCAESWALAFIAYARQNKSQLPTSFEQAESLWEQVIQKETGMSAEQFETQYGTMSDQYELLYHGSLASISNANGVILFRDKNPRPLITGKWGKNFALVYREDISTDRGPHVAYCSSSDKTATGNWRNFEQEHSVTVADQ